MFIKLRNNAIGHRDEDIWINTDHISAVYEHAKVEGGGLTTFVYSVIGNTITWEVEESVSQVIKLIEDANAKR
jgi:hypothetical protein